MQVTIYPSKDGPDLWDLRVNGETQIKGETMTMVEAVRDALSARGRFNGPVSEADEIAERIRAAFEE